MTRKRTSLTPDGHDGATMSFVGPGSTLSERYRLTAEIGRGAMGVIYEAFDERLDDRRVAIKVLPPELANNARAKKRLRREALAAIELTHTNILRCYDFAEDGATAYLVMEYLDGKTLDDALADVDDERLPLDEVHDIARQVCAALDYAHQKGVIHRDIKPQNLMYHHDGTRQLVKVTDFGIAYQIKDSLTRLTGQVSSGTLLYIAPEQLRNAKPTGQSDQYSLAATLYELLTGDPPLTGPALSTTILTVAPRPIEGLPDYVNEALLKALAKDPADRYPSMAEFGAAFCGDGEYEATAAKPVAPAAKPQVVAAEPKPATEPQAAEPQAAAELKPATEPQPAAEEQPAELSTRSGRSATGTADVGDETSQATCGEIIGWTFVWAATSSFILSRVMQLIFRSDISSDEEKMLLTLLFFCATIFSTGFAIRTLIALPSSNSEDGDEQ